ncbi:MAG: inositol monophosphatase family protein [Candidatus Diapherotrites archaeon]
MLAETKAAIAAAKKAGKIIMASFGKKQETRQKSSPFDLVTKTDVAAEKEIISMLSKNFPNYGFLAEESGKTHEQGDFTWIIDPLDGTHNFISGIPYFCTAIALAKGDEVVCGVVFDPTRKELFYAEKGKGAFLNGRKILVSDKSDLRDFMCITSVRAGLEGEPPAKRQERFLNFYPNVRAMRMLGASELDLCYLAAGRLEVFVNFNMFPWDGAAGALLVQEAGGTATDEKGLPWKFMGKSLIATNGKRHREVLGILGL